MKVKNMFTLEGFSTGESATLAVCTGLVAVASLARAVSASRFKDADRMLFHTFALNVVQQYDGPNTPAVSSCGSEQETDRRRHGDAFARLRPLHATFISGEQLLGRRHIDAELRRRILECLSRELSATMAQVVEPNGGETDARTLATVLHSYELIRSKLPPTKRAELDDAARLIAKQRQSQRRQLFRSLGTVVRDLPSSAAVWACAHLVVSFSTNLLDTLLPRLIIRKHRSVDGTAPVATHKSYKEFLWFFAVETCVVGSLLGCANGITKMTEQRASLHVNSAIHGSVVNKLARADQSYIDTHTDVLDPTALMHTISLYEEYVWGSVRPAFDVLEIAGLIYATAREAQSAGNGVNGLLPVIVGIVAGCASWHLSMSFRERFMMPMSAENGASGACLGLLRELECEVPGSSTPESCDYPMIAALSAALSLEEADGVPLYGLGALVEVGWTPRTLTHGLATIRNASAGKVCLESLKRRRDEASGARRMQLVDVVKVIQSSQHRPVDQSDAQITTAGVRQWRDGVQPPTVSVDTILSSRVLTTLRCFGCEREMMQHALSKKGRDATNPTYVQFPSAATSRKVSFSALCDSVLDNLLGWQGPLDILLNAVHVAVLMGVRPSLRHNVSALFVLHNVTTNIARRLCNLSIFESYVAAPYSAVPSWEQDLGYVTSIAEMVPKIDVSGTPEGERKVHNVSLRGEIEFVHVSFAYPGAPSELALDDVSFRIPAGSFVGIVGESGSGKSTLALLINRIYDPSEGVILLDGRPLADYDVGWLRRQIPVASQFAHVVPDVTVEDNILLGCPRDRERAVAAATSACLHDFIMTLPGQYATVLGGWRGMRLSSGQQQRLHLARAFARTPNGVLVLDEMTSALDSITEHSVLECVQGLGQATTLCIAHRLSTIRDAGYVLVLGKGRLLEAGPPTVLLKKEGGVYASLVRAQQIRSTHRDAAILSIYSTLEAAGVDVAKDLLLRDHLEALREADVDGI